MANKSFLLGDDISASSVPLQMPAANSPRVLVLGGGVVGLTTAWLLLDQGYHVTILAKEWPSWTDEARISSQAAGALWKVLPLECGPQAVLDNLSTNQRWILESHKVYSAIAANPDLHHLVEMRPCTIVTTDAVDGNEIMLKKLEWIKSADIPGFRRSPELFKEYGINTEHAGGLLDAYEYMAPVINVDNAMGFLMDLVRNKGATLETGEVTGNLVEQESQLLKEHKANAIVNATGLGASELAGDDNVYGLHGALLRIINDGSDFPVIQNAMVVSSTKAGTNAGEGAFILPRKDNILALGTISQAKGTAADLTISSPAVQEMRSRCEDLLPCLKNARLDPTYPIIQGTRPQRKGGVRVERESRVIHSYGHGGAGWSLAFGTARESMRLVSEVALPITVSSVSSISETVCQMENVMLKTGGYDMSLPLHA